MLSAVEVSLLELASLQNACSKGMQVFTPDAVSSPVLAKAGLRCSCHCVHQRLYCQVSHPFYKALVKDCGIAFLALLLYRQLQHSCYRNLQLKPLNNVLPAVQSGLTGILYQGIAMVLQASSSMLQLSPTGSQT